MLVVRIIDPHGHRQHATNIHICNVESLLYYAGSDDVDEAEQWHSPTLQTQGGCQYTRGKVEQHYPLLTRKMVPITGPHSEFGARCGKTGIFLLEGGA